MSEKSTVVLVGVAGASGSGKTFFANAVKQDLPVSSLILSQDDYYKDRSDLSPAERERINYDHPDALDFDLLIRHLKILKEGKAIEHPLYDFAIHNRRPNTAQTGPAQVVLMDGILIYAVDECRDLFDFKVYVETPLDLCFIRRLTRDTTERGRTVDSVIEQYQNTVRPMYLEYVAPTQMFADFVVTGIGDMRADVDYLIAQIV